MVSMPILHACAPLLDSTNNRKSLDLQKKLSVLERAAQGRLGLSLINTVSNDHFSYRAEERFPFCSTFKVLVAAAILNQSMQDHHLLTKRIYYSPTDLSTSGYAPITEKYLNDGMTVEALCTATIQYSDNAAANLLMKELGGPQAITAFAQSIDDHVFRLDRWEPELNTAIPDDVRDTSTPLAMAQSLKKLVLSDALGLVQRALLATWLQGNTTGDKRIRASLPQDWLLGDKTGTGAYGTTNDVAVIWPKDGDPMVLTVYFTQFKKDAKPRDDVIAAATRIVLQKLD